MRTYNSQETILNREEYNRSLRRPSVVHETPKTENPTHQLVVLATNKPSLSPWRQTSCQIAGNREVPQRFFLFFLLLMGQGAAI
jgi:hypothetical protein